MVLCTVGRSTNNLQRTKIVGGQKRRGFSSDRLIFA